MMRGRAGGCASSMQKKTRRLIAMIEAPRLFSFNAPQA
jgi:hypothetical protein